MINKQVKLAARPQGLPKDSDWALDETPVPEPGDGEVLVKVSHISVDPAMRGWMNEGATYIEGVELGAVMRAGGAGTVVKSNAPNYPEGATVQGMFGVQEYASASAKDIFPIDPNLAPIGRFLGVLGMPGMTAYFGLLDIGEPKEGDTVVISGAAGAVGSVAGQIAKIKGCRTVGIAGGPEKCDMLVNELGFDAAIDYKNSNVRAGLKEHCPKGIDVYFDNVGGEILDAALARLAQKARVVISGAISQYNTDKFKGPDNYMRLLVCRARMEGFVVFDYVREYGKAAMEMAGWIAEGKLKAKEHTVRGIEKFPAALMMLFNGDNVGKLVLEVGGD